MRLFLCAALVVAALALGSCSKEQAAAPAGPPPKRAVNVLAAKVQRRTIPLEIRTFGAVESFATVSIKAMTGGEIMSVNFKEGQDVKQTDLLFEIDPRPLQAALRQAEANYSRDKVNADNAQRELERYQALQKRGAATADEVDQAEARSQAAAATLKADAATVENAKVFLEYATIKSPITGRTGALLVDRGNIVKANDVPMVVINQLKPINVTFSVAEAMGPVVRKFLAQRQLKVEVSIPGEVQTVVGKLAFVDNQVDRTTGTLRLKGEFANDDERLWPGQFVNIVLTLDDEEALLAPSQAVQVSGNERWVYVIDDANVAHMRRVKIGRLSGGYTAITDGLTAGETVVTDGHLNLTDGSSVQIRQGLLPTTAPTSGKAVTTSAPDTIPAVSSTMPSPK